MIPGRPTATMEDPPTGVGLGSAAVTTLPYTTGLNGVNLGVDKLTT